MLSSDLVFATDFPLNSKVTFSFPFVYQPYFYKVVLSDSGTLSLTSSSPLGGVDYVHGSSISIYDEFGNQNFYNSGGSDVVLSETLPAGTYYVSLFSYDSNAHLTDFTVSFANALNSSPLISDISLPVSSVLPISVNTKQLLTSNVNAYMISSDVDLTFDADSRDNIVFGNDGYNKINGGAGNDYIDGGSGDDTIDGGAGNDTIYGTSGLNFIKGGLGNDIIYGGIDDDYIDGGDDNDIINTHSPGNNTVIGGKGDDSIDSSDGNDKIDGGDGNDLIDGGNGRNNILGGKGNDSVFTGYQNDKIDGGDDNDSIDAGDGRNNVVGGKGADSITTGLDNDKIDGGDDNDIINAGDGLNIVTGGKGDDSITTGFGNDTIDGGLGLDTLVGGLGNDTLTGGADSDIFVLSLAGGIDKVTDFKIDKLVFTDSLTPVALDASHFVSAITSTFVFSDSSPAFGYNTKTGALFYDADGSAVGEQVQIALIANKAILVASDILI